MLKDGAYKSSYFGKIEIQVTIRKYMATCMNFY